MKVIFTKDISGVARKNDLKDVSEGYARNFLFPRNLAHRVSPEALKSLTVQKERAEKEASAKLESYKSVAEGLKGVVLTFRIKIGEKGRAFGSVTAVKIRDALKKLGILVEKDWIELSGPIKSSGEHAVKIKLPEELEGEIKVLVEAEHKKIDI